MHTRTGTNVVMPLTGNFFMILGNSLNTIFTTNYPIKFDGLTDMNCFPQQIKMDYHVWCLSVFARDIAIIILPG